MVLSTAKGKAQEITAEFPYVSRYQKIEGNNLHYIDTGKGNTILFLHGIPMSSYSWRNIIPHVSDTARCIALDFMGFGRSDKPDLSYEFDDQYRYLSAFIEGLGLKDITLVMTDIGGILGQKYARLHPEQIKGLVFMETPLTNAETFHKNGGMMQRMMFWMAGRKRLGYKMFVRKNMFIKMMPMLIKRKLTREEKKIYAAPFETEESRIPIYALPNSFPKKGKMAKEGDMADYLNKNAEWLSSSEHPKLLLTAKPGMIVNAKAIEWSQKNLDVIQIEEMGRARHLMEEDLPHQIGSSLRTWYLSIQ